MFLSSDEGKLERNHSNVCSFGDFKVNRQNCEVISLTLGWEALSIKKENQNKNVNLYLATIFSVSGKKLSDYLPLNLQNFNKIFSVNRLINRSVKRNG